MADETTTPEGGDQIDSLLSEFDGDHLRSDTPAGAPEDAGASRQEPEQQDQPERVDSKALDDALQYIQEDRRAKLTATLERTIDAAVQVVAEDLADLPSAPGSKTVRGLLYERYHTDPAFMNAFLNAPEDPETWNRSLGRAVQDLRGVEEFNINRAATETRAAVMASVRGTVQEPPEETQMTPEAAAKMTNAELQAWERERGRSFY